MKILLCLALKYPDKIFDFFPHYTFFFRVCQNCEFGCYFIFPKNMIGPTITHRCLTFILIISTFLSVNVRGTGCVPACQGALWDGCDAKILKSHHPQGWKRPPGSLSPTSHCKRPSPGSAALPEFQHNFLSLETYAKKPRRFLKWKCHFHASNVFYGAF